MSEKHPFSPESIRKAAHDQPLEQAGIGIVAEPGDVGIVAQVNKDLGKPGGWTFAATGHWWKQKGYQAAAWLGWTGTPKT